MRYTKPEFFYHITDKWWKKRVKLHPKTDGPHRDPDEPKIARICVSKTIYGCVSAISCCLGTRMYIYRTYHRVKAAYTWGVADARITQERWLVRPTTFLRVGKIPTKYIEEIDKHPDTCMMVADPNFLDRQKAMLENVIKPILKPLVEAL